MSKVKSKKAAGTSAKSPEARSKVIEDPANAAPVFSESSFTNLRDRISAQLKTVDQNPKNKTDQSKKTQKNPDVSSRGKKRTADGTVVKPQQRNGAAGSRNAVEQADAGDGEEEFRQALKELGGTEEDLDLIGDADSDSELEGRDGEVIEKQNPKKKSTSLQDGMSNILKEIALALKDHDDDEDSDASEEDEEQEDEDKKDVRNAEKQALLAAELSTSKTLSNKKTSNSRLKCEPRADWFNISSPNINLEKGPVYTASLQTIEKAHAYAKTLLEAENEAFKSTQQSSSSQAFYNTVIASGTLSDKISALTLAVQESPLHNVKALEVLIGLASKRSRGQAIDVLRALKDLFAQGSLLPGDRRLSTFATQPALLAAFGQIVSWKEGDKLPQGLEQSDLICWAYEDWLKQRYFEILKILEVWCNDEIEFAKGRAVSYVYELLKEKPEQESNLLRLLVNKLGDPVKKIASQASYLLMQLLLNHPAMKAVVISAIEADFIFRSGQSLHGKYYAVVTINQTALSSREEEVAQKLLDIYFGLFTAILKPAEQEKGALEDVKSEGVESQSRAQRQRKKKKPAVDNPQSEELREKLVSAVLTGINRAYPYAGADQKNFTDHLETLFKITHSANFNTSVQAMLLIQQLTSTHSATSERFYRTLYESLLDPRLITASKQQLYLNLLHRSLKADMNIKRIKAFVKRLLQTLSLHDASFICGVFFLLKDLEQTYPSLTALVDQPEDHETDEEVFRDVDEEAAGADTESSKKPSEDQSTTTTYDAHKRDPSHANADNACAWEILPFLAHFHPSVTVSANHFLQHTKLPGKPDLTLHTLIHFLDRFVYRNPKLASNKLRGSSIMQPTVASDAHAVLISSASRSNLLSVNTDEFRNKKGTDVAADDVFFHKYFTTLGKETKSKDKKRRDRDSDDESIGDEGEDEVWKAMVDSAPDLEGEGSDNDDLDDLDMSDFEDEMTGSDDVDMDDGSEVDIEAGIFDDSDDDVSAGPDQDSNDEPAFEGLDSAPDDDEEEADEEDVPVNAKAQARKEKTKAEKERKKKLKALPTFASAMDYAKMLDDDEDEDLG